MYKLSRTRELLSENDNVPEVTSDFIRFAALRTAGTGASSDSVRRGASCRSTSRLAIACVPDQEEDSGRDAPMLMFTDEDLSDHQSGACKHSS